MALKIWLSLTLLVLLVHLALMQALFPAPQLMQTSDSLTFATRTVLLPEPPPTPPTSAVTGVPDKARTKPARPATQKPAARTTTVLPPIEPHDLSPAMAPAELPTPAVHPSPSGPQTVASNAVAHSALAPVSEPGAEPTVQGAVFSADALPASVKLVYRVEANKFPFRLRSELVWQHSDRSYQARLSINALGQARVQTSRGQIDPLGLAPERFSDKSRSEVAAHFNRAQGLVSFSANTPSIALLPGAQDRLSVLIQLAALVASAPQDFSPGSALKVQTIGPRDGDLWLFTFGGMEVIELPGGPRQGLKLVRQPRQLYDQKLEVWLAPDLDYLPARIRITETNGDYVDQKWLASEAADGP